MSHRIHRRNFIKTSVAASAFACAAPVVFKKKVFGDDSPNERFVIAGVGVGGMGRGDMNDHRRFGDIAALCDVDEVRLNEANKAIDGKADTYKDYRKVLERKDIDVVSIATVDHWHVKIAVEAMMAGKHVFCQKPLTFSLEEVQYVRDACKKYNKQVFQVGTQQRDAKNLFLRAIRMVQNGVLGDIQNIVAGIPACPVGGPF